MDNSNIPWIEKYRPKTLDDISYHDNIKKTIKNFIEKGQFAHLLLAGPPGVGKTSMILCCSRELYGKENIPFMVLKLNSSSQRGIDCIRNIVKGFIKTNTYSFAHKNVSNVNFKLIILDEIDSMTPEAQGMLRQIMESHSRYARFCLICNDLEKINIALQSRCALLQFSPLPTEFIIERLIDICKKEKITYSKKNIMGLVETSKGDMRSAINILQSSSTALNNNLKNINTTDIYGVFNTNIIADLFDILLSKKNLNIKSQKIYETIENNNINLSDLLNELASLVVDTDDVHDDIKLDIISELSIIEQYCVFNPEPKYTSVTIAACFCY